jgi:hypothetical protein
MKPCFDRGQFVFEIILLTLFFVPVFGMLLTIEDASIWIYLVFAFLYLVFVNVIRKGNWHYPSI